MDRLDVTFEERAGGAQRGAPRDFTAYTRTQTSPQAPQVNQILKVNGPLKFGGASVFLLGNGYAPVITVRDALGQVLMREATPFLPQDANYKSVGAVNGAVGRRLSMPILIGGRSPSGPTNTDFGLPSSP